MGGKGGCPPECITRQQDSRVPSGPPTLSLQISRTHTEGTREARWVVGPDLNPPLPLVNPYTLASSLTLCLSVPIRRVGITVQLTSWAATGAFFPLPSPTKGTSVFVIITKMIVTENQMQGFCPEVRGGGSVDEAHQGRKPWGCGGVAGRGTSVGRGPWSSPCHLPKAPGYGGALGAKGLIRGQLRALHPPADLSPHRARRSIAVCRTASVGLSASRVGVSAALPTPSRPQSVRGTLEDSTSPMREKEWELACTGAHCVSDPMGAAPRGAHSPGMLVTDRCPGREQVLSGRNSRELAGEGRDSASRYVAPNGFLEAVTF